MMKSHFRFIVVKVFMNKNSKRKNHKTSNDLRTYFSINGVIYGHLYEVLIPIISMFSSLKKKTFSITINLDVVKFHYLTVTFRKHLRDFINRALAAHEQSKPISRRVQSFRLNF